MNIQKTKTAIFIDFDNLFFSLRENYGITPTEKINNQTIIDNIIKNYKNDHIIICNAYADFQAITNLSRETNTMYELQSRRITIKHVFGSLAKNENRKNASDIELSIDVIESIFTKPDIEKYIIISADSDMMPIINRLKFEDKEVILYYLNSACSQFSGLLNHPNESIPIENMFDLSIETLNDKIIEEKYLIPFLQKIIKMDKNNKTNENYIGVAWIKNQLQNKNFFQNEELSFSGINATKFLDFLLENGYIININKDRVNQILPNYEKELVKKIMKE